MHSCRIVWEIDHSDPAFFENSPGTTKDRAPERIGKVWRQRVQGRDAGLDDRPGALGTGMEGRDQGGAGRAQTGPRRREDHVALGVLDS